MQYDFDLATVLTVTTGIECTNDLGDVFDLFCFIFEDDLLDPATISEKRKSAREHILNIHPELNTIYYNPKVNVNEWVEKQKDIFGNEITISVIGEPIITLKKQPLVSAR